MLARHGGLDPASAHLDSSPQVKVQMRKRGFYFCLQPCNGQATPKGIEIWGEGKHIILNSSKCKLRNRFGLCLGVCFEGNMRRLTELDQRRIIEKTAELVESRKFFETDGETKNLVLVDRRILNDLFDELHRAGLVQYGFNQARFQTDLFLGRMVPASEESVG